MEKTYRWTVDVETDWGGRTDGTLGLKYGIPKILREFKRRRVRGLFFISTELLQSWKHYLRPIKDDGHEIGSHGHFHEIFKNPQRREQDRQISDIELVVLTSKWKHHYRAPKFSYVTEDRYSNPKNHVSLLRHMWLGEKIKEETIIYLHPFDIVETWAKAPNLFCRLWYSQPKRALKTFEKLVECYT